MQKKTLRGITPYNECWFRTCYYHQLMSALSYFGVPKEYTLLDYKAKCTPFTSWKDFSFKDGPILSDEEFCELTGVSQKKYHAEDIAAAAIKSIDANHPIIVGQDNYYLSYRPHYFGKAHCTHFVLCYGYDKAQNSVTISEQEFVTHYDFLERKVPLEEFCRAYKGFCENFPDYDWSVEEFCVSAAKSPFAKRAAHIGKIADELRRSNLAELIKPFFSLSELKEEDVERMFAYCTFFTKYVRVLMKQYEIFSGKTDIVEGLEKIWQHAQLVQAVMVKALCLHDLNDTRAEMVLSRVENMFAVAEISDKEIAKL